MTILREVSDTTVRFPDKSRSMLRVYYALKKHIQLGKQSLIAQRDQRVYPGGSARGY